MVAIVTGGSKGIGLAIAQAFVARGDRVAISGRSQDDLDRAVRALGDNAIGVRADARTPEDATALVEAAVTKFGGVDVLVNNAGVGRFASVADMSLEDWHDVIGTNLSGMFYCCRAAIPELRRRGGGYIFNISSLAGTNAFPGAAAYCASKAGVDQFSEALMQEVRHDGIRVSYIKPGSVATNFNDGDPASGANWKLSAADVARVVIDLLSHDARSLPSRVDIRPSRPPRT